MFGRAVVGDFTVSALGEAAATASMSRRRCGEPSDGSQERKTAGALSRLAIVAAAAAADGAAAVTTTVFALGDAGTGGGCVADGVADAEFDNTVAAVAAFADDDGVWAELALGAVFDCDVTAVAVAADAAADDGCVTVVVFALADDSAPSASFAVSAVACLLFGFVAFALHCKKIN